MAHESIGRTQGVSEDALSGGSPGSLLPPRKRGPARSLWLFLVLAAVLFYIGPLRTEVRFTDDLGRVPEAFQVTLSSGKERKIVTVENGRLHVLRGKWEKLQVTDDSYLGIIRDVAGGNIAMIVERNALMKMRDAAIGLPSVRQAGDPDPRRD